MNFRGSHLIFRVQSRFYLAAVLSVLPWLLAACRTATSRNEKLILDGEDHPTKLDNDPDVQSAEALKAVPPALWSPAQRQANASYFFLTAEYLMAKGEVAKAAALFEATYNLDPSPIVGSKMIASEIVQGNIERAMPQAKRMVLLYPKKPMLRLIYGQLLAKTRKVDEAVDELKEAVELDHHFELAYLNLIDVYEQRKDFDSAVSVARTLTKNNPTSVHGWVELSKLYLSTNRKKEALLPARRAYELQGTNPETVVVYALALELNGKSKEAVQLYEQLYRLNPTNEELIARMVQLYSEIGDLKNALDILDNLAQAPGGDRPGVQVQRAIILWEMRRFEEASQVLDKISAENPESDRLKYFSGLGHERLEHYEKALEIYKTIPESSQLKLQSQLRSAAILRELKRFPEAHAMIQRIVLDPDSTWEVYELGANVYGDEEKFDDAIQFLSEGYKKFPDKPRLLFLIGVYHEKKNDIARCIATMREVIKVDPTNAGAFNYLGYLFAERNEHLDEAEKLISKALELKPNDGFYLDSLGWVYYQRKDYAKAQAYLEKALTLVPSEGVIMEHLGDVFLQQGQQEKALKSYQEALKTKLEKRDQDRIEGKFKDLSAKVKK